MSALFKDFDWKNGTFNAAQGAYLKVFAQNQIETFLSGQTDEAKAEKHLKAVYSQLGKPDPSIQWFDSPIALVTSVGDSVGDSVWASVRASVWASVWDSVWASVGDSVWASVGASVGDSVWASVGDSVGDSVRAWYDGGWVSFYKFFSQEFEKNALDDWCAYCEQVNGGILTDDVAYLVRKPKRLVRNAAGLLHYDHDKAIEWNDGTGFYYLGGVEFDKKLWQKIIDQKITLGDLGNITNADQRAVAVQMLRADRLLKQVKAKKVDTGERGVELYEVPNFMDTGDTEYCLKLEHPTIKSKFYIEWVEPKIGKKKSADYAMAVSRGISVEQYLEAELA